MRFGVQLQIPPVLPELLYTLSVQGTGGHNFHQLRTVEVKTKTLSIFVQTDKAIYKPGQEGNLMHRNVII